MIIDAATPTTAALDCLKAAGVTAVIRYYARETRLPGKRLTRDEAEALVAAGLSIGAVFQNAGDSAGCFSREIGAADAAHASDYAMATIGQPAGSAIYFAVDYEAGKDDVETRIIPHFRAVAATMAGRYRVGVYGSARVCRAVRAAGLADYAWLSNRPGSLPFDGWTLRQQLPTSLCGMAVDRSELHCDAAGFGSFATLGAPVRQSIEGS